MKNDLNELKKVTAELMNGNFDKAENESPINRKIFEEIDNKATVMLNPPNNKPLILPLPCKNTKKYSFLNLLKDIAEEEKMLQMN